MLLGVWVPYALAHTEDWFYEDDNDEPVYMPKGVAECCTALADDSATAIVSSASARSEDEAECLEEDCEVQPNCGLAAPATLGRSWPCDSADGVATEEGQMSTELPSIASEVESSPESCTVLETTRDEEEDVQDKPAAASQAAGATDQSTVADTCSPCLGDNEGHVAALHKEDFESPPERDIAVQAIQQRFILPCDSTDAEVSMEEETLPTEILTDMSEPWRSPEFSTVMRASREAGDDKQDKQAAASQAAAATDESTVADTCSPILGDNEGHMAAFHEEDFESPPERDIAVQAIQQRIILPSDSTDAEMSMEEELLPTHVLMDMSKPWPSPEFSTVMRASREAGEDEQDKPATPLETAAAKCPDVTVRSTVADAFSPNSGNDEGTDAELAGEDGTHAPSCVLTAQTAEEHFGPCEHFIDESVSREVETPAESSPATSKTGDTPAVHQTLGATGRIEEGRFAAIDGVEQTWSRSHSRGSKVQVAAVVHKERLPQRRTFFHDLPAIKIRGRGGLDARASSAGGSARDSSTWSPDSAVSSQPWLQESSVVSACGVDAADLTPRTHDISEQSDICSRQSSPLNPVRIWSAYPECGRVPAMSLLPAYAVRPKLAREQSASRHAGQVIEPSSKAITHSVKKSCQPWQLPKQGHDRCTKDYSAGRGMHPEFESRTTVRLPPLLPAKSTSSYSSKKVPFVTAESTNRSVVAAPAGLRAWRRSRSAACTDPVW
eukprot:TRINITY_DN1944_c0_g1_i1.p1 TRINITY_DN1944_c0_g1~~TRINITY_DN1944_c0_g1_i1.p1  ORF type:complete len:772 (-),score=140.60 TRINITY_DN1944_c0_g1_i1:188-2362(-)